MNYTFCLFISPTFKEKGTRWSDAVNRNRYEFDFDFYDNFSFNKTEETFTPMLPDMAALREYLLSNV